MSNLKVTITKVPDPLLPDNVIAVIDGTPIVAAGKSKQEVWKELITSLAITIAHNSGLDYKELTYELKDSPYQGSAGVWVKASERLPEIRKAVPVKIDGDYGVGNFADNRNGDIRFWHNGKNEWFMPQSFPYIFWLDSAASPAGGGWVSVEEQMPEHNIGVLVFIPDEDDHITSGMWDIEDKWVLLDDYRVPECEVTHWRPLPSPPKTSV